MADTERTGIHGAASAYGRNQGPSAPITQAIQAFAGAFDHLHHISPLERRDVCQLVLQQLKVEADFSELTKAPWGMSDYHGE